MIYQIVNYFIEKKITKLRPMAKRLLIADTHASGADMAKERLDMDRKYILLINHFRDDPKHRFLVNSNYHKYLEAIIYLYTTSSSAVQAGILTASTEVYHTIKIVQLSFDETLHSFGMK